MYRSPFLRVWANMASRGRCKHCGRPIVWMITDRGKNIPLAPTAIAVRTEKDPETHKTFDLYARDAVHFATCPNPPLRRPPVRTWDVTR